MKASFRNLLAVLALSFVLVGCGQHATTEEAEAPADGSAAVESSVTVDESADAEEADAEEASEEAAE